MATPDYSFIYPNTEYRFFVVYNTFYDLPYTIPMDLATFIAYHLKSGRMLEGLYECYEDLIETGFTMADTHINEFISAEELAYQYEVIDTCNLLQIAKQQQDACNALHELFISGQANRSNLKGILNKFHIEIRPLSFYFSMHYTIDWEFNDASHMDLSTDELSKIKSDFAKYSLENPHQRKSNFVEKPHEAYLHYITNEGMPLEFVPHIYRSTQLYRSRCEQQNLQFLLPDDVTWKVKATQPHLSNRISSEQFPIVRTEITVEIARIYLEQVSLFYDEVRQALDKINCPVSDLTLNDIEKLLTIEHDFGWTQHLLPEIYFDPSIEKDVRYVYYFSVSGQPPDLFTTIYTDIGGLSFDQGGLAKMQVFNEYYVLCNAKGEELTPSNCQDLDIGPNGFIIMRAPPGWWEYYRFELNSGLIDVSEEFRDFDPHKAVSIEFRDLLPFMYEEFVQEKESLFYMGKGNKAILEELIDSNWLANPAAEVLLEYYRSDNELAKKIINKHHSIFLLLLTEQIQDPELIAIFAQNAPQGVYDVAAKMFDLPPRKQPES